MCFPGYIDTVAQDIVFGGEAMMANDERLQLSHE